MKQTETFLNHENELDAPTQRPSKPFSNPQRSVANATSEAMPGVGSCFNGYEIISEIARGGMGVVFRAKQSTLNRIVAIKMILDESTGCEDHRQRFANEAEAAAKLDHPHIVPVYDVGETHGYPYFSMAYVEGKSLASLLLKGPLEPRRAAEIAFHVADAISVAHDQQIIHRDLKPANILMDSQGLPRITDFGVCKLLSTASNLTASGEMIGTPHYMPPEQAGNADTSVCPASDVYSIGAVMYAMLTGRPPFQAANPVEVVSQVLTKDPVSPRSLNATTPVDLDVVVMKCLEKSPHSRYPSARELRDEIRLYLDGKPIKTKPPGWPRQIQHAFRRHVFVASVSGSAALLMILLMFLTLLALMKSRSEMADMQVLLEAERATALRYAQSFASSRKQPLSPEEYDVLRLADSAKRLNETQPDVSLKLAIESVSIALQHGSNLPSGLIDMLNKSVEGNEQGEDSLDNESQSNTELSIEQLLEEAKKRVRKPFTPSERLIYGITDPAPHIINEEHE